MQYYFGFLLVGIINTWESTYFYEAEASYLTVQPLLSNTNWADPLASTCRKLKANRNQLQKRIQPRKQIGEKILLTSPSQRSRRSFIYKVMKAWRDNISGKLCENARYRKKSIGRGRHACIMKVSSHNHDINNRAIYVPLPFVFVLCRSPLNGAVVVEVN